MTMLKEHVMISHVLLVGSLSSNKPKWPMGSYGLWQCQQLQSKMSKHVNQKSFHAINMLCICHAYCILYMFNLKMTVLEKRRNMSHGVRKSCALCPKRPKRPKMVLEMAQMPIGRQEIMLDLELCWNSAFWVKKEQCSLCHGEYPAHTMEFNQPMNIIIWVGILGGDIAILRTKTQRNNLLMLTSQLPNLLKNWQKNHKNPAHFFLPYGTSVSVLMSDPKTPTFLIDYIHKFTESGLTSAKHGSHRTAALGYSLWIYFFH